MKKIITYLILVLLSSSVFAQQNVLEDEALLIEVKKGIDKIYNYEFEAAKKIFKPIYEKHPTHPLTPFLKGMLIAWENMPLTLEHSAFEKFENYMLESGKYAQKRLKKDKKDLEGVFFDMSARGMLMQVYSDNGYTTKVMREAEVVYEHIKKGFELQKEFKEFYFTVGLYNYYREAYPDKKPIYKPLVWLFKSGDKAEGLRQLNYAGNHAIFVKAESLAFLHHIYLTFEEKTTKALPYSQKLLALYPENTLFLAKHTETLLILKKYEEAEVCIHKLLNKPKKDTYAALIGNIFKAVYLEHAKKDLEAAQTYYLKGLEIAKSYGERAYGIAVYGYLGLSRIAKENQDEYAAKKYYKKAKKVALYDYVFSD